MRKYIYAALAALSLAVIPVSSAMAQDMDGDNDVRMDTDNDFDIRPYVGAGIGAFGLELKNTAGSQKNTVFGGYAKAGVDIGDYLGAELRLGTTGSGTTGTTKLSESYFISYLAKVQYPASSDLNVYAMLGGTTANFKRTVSGVESSKSKTGFSYGFGAEYYLQDTLSIGGEWMQYWTNVKLGTAFGTDAKAKMWGAVGTVAYHF